MRFWLEGRGKRRSERWGCKDFGASSLPRRWILWASGAPALTPLTQPVPHIILITLSPRFSFLYFVCFFRCLLLPPVFLHGCCTSFLTTLFLYTVSYHVSFLAFHYSPWFQLPILFLLLRCSSLVFLCPRLVALPVFTQPFQLLISLSQHLPGLPSFSLVFLSSSLPLLLPAFQCSPHFFVFSSCIFSLRVMFQPLLHVPVGESGFVQLKWLVLEFGCCPPLL